MSALKIAAEDAEVTEPRSRRDLTSSIIVHEDVRQRRESARGRKPLPNHTIPQGDEDQAMGTSSSSMLVPLLPGVLDQDGLLQLHRQIRNLSRVIRKYRISFIDEASRLVSALAIPVETSQPLTASNIIDIYSNLQRLRDAYGPLEDEYERLERRAEDCEQKLLDDRAKALRQRADDGPHMELPTYENPSEPSEASVYDLDEALFVDWLNVLARAERTFKSLQELAKRKASIIEKIQETDVPYATVSPYPEALIADYDDEYQAKMKQLRDTEEQLLGLRNKLRERGHSLPDDILNFEKGILTEEPPARNPLLLPIDDLLAEAYDKASAFQIDTLPNTSAQRLAKHVNAWLLHILCRSALHAISLALELDSYGIRMDEEAAQRVKVMWSQDEPSQRLNVMSDRIYYARRGSINMLEPTEEPLPGQYVSALAIHGVPSSPSFLSIDLGNDSDPNFDLFADVDLETVPIVPRRPPTGSSSEEPLDDGPFNPTITPPLNLPLQDATSTPPTRSWRSSHKPQSTRTQAGSSLPAPLREDSKNNPLTSPLDLSPSIHTDQLLDRAQGLPAGRAKSWSDPLPLSRSEVQVSSDQARQQFAMLRLQ